MTEWTLSPARLPVSHVWISWLTELPPCPGVPSGCTPAPGNAAQFRGPPPTHGHCLASTCLTMATTWLVPSVLVPLLATLHSMPRHHLGKHEAACFLGELSSFRQWTLIRGGFLGGERTCQSHGGTAHSDSPVCEPVRSMGGRVRGHLLPEGSDPGPGHCGPW